MFSKRPTSWQREFDFGDDSADETVTLDAEPQRGQSTSANTQQPSLDQNHVSLMEKIVDDANMEQAWKNVRGNKGAPAPMV